ncbi:MAG: hypothetical protein ACYCWE_15700 [Eubacteriales bacterium]
MKKVLVIFLILLLMTSLFSACAAKSAEPASTEKVFVSETSAESVTETVYKAEIPAGLNYGGAEFNIYTYPDASSGEYWVDVDFCATEENGEVINDATYARLRYTEETLGVTFKAFPADSAGVNLRKSVQANDRAFDFAFINAYGAVSLASQGIIYNMRTIGNLQLDAPWWDQSIIEGLSVANNVYLLTGDISIMPKKTLRVIYFNKLIAENYDIDNPYELVDKMAWTIDKFAEISAVVSDDIDGNGTMDKNDRYGLLFRSNSIGPFMVSAGVIYAGKTTDDLPFLSFYNERTQSVWDKYISLCYNDNIAFSQDGPGGAEVVPMFIADQGLFMSVELHNLQFMREMANDFGILPNPLLDESQESYYSTINPNVAAVLVIPNDCPDTERTAYVLDIMGAQAKNILTPAYIETYLKGKTSRDAESESTLNIILGSVRYDLGHCFNWGNIGAFTQTVFGAYKEDLASSYSSIEKAAQEALNNSIQQYLKLA